MFVGIVMENRRMEVKCLEFFLSRKFSILGRKFKACMNYVTFSGIKKQLIAGILNYITIYICHY